MKRNEDRIWFDKGYREAIRDRKEESFWPKIIFVWVLLTVTYMSPGIAVAFLFIYSAFEYQDYRDSKKFRTREEPPEMWE